MRSLGSEVYIADGEVTLTILPHVKSVYLFELLFRRRPALHYDFILTGKRSKCELLTKGCTEIESAMRSFKISPWNGAITGSFRGAAGFRRKGIPIATTSRYRHGTP